MAPIASRNFTKHCFLTTWIFDIRDLDYFEPAGCFVIHGSSSLPGLGANLARRELAEALKILARRLPNPRRIGSPPWKPLLGMSGPTSVPMRFG
jgi:hypothetical protein